MEKRTVLFVDDDEIMLRSLERGLFDEPYSMHFASSGDEAIEILQREEVHVIVTDMCMPGMGGLELLKTVKETYPRIVSIVLSGFAPTADLMSPTHKVEIFKFICKSQKLEEHLKPAIRQAINSYNLQSEHEDVLAQLGRGSDR
jgi:two-component system response regulator HupR/HoxA